jgi:hypothetical protein
MSFAVLSHSLYHVLTTYFHDRYALPIGSSSQTETYVGESPFSLHFNPVWIALTAWFLSLYYFIWFRYVGLYLCDLFYQKFHRYPSEFISDQREFEIDLYDLKQIYKNLSNKYSINSDKQEILEELCGYGGSELRSIAAFIGGYCARESFKLITHQYVPIDNTLIYNGIQQSTNVFKI